MGDREKHNSLKGDGINSIENHLSGILKPVLPRTEFIDHLRGKIQHIHQPAMIKRFTNWQLYLLMLLGAISGTLLVYFLATYLVALFRKRDIHQPQS